MAKQRTDGPKCVSCDKPLRAYRLERSFESDDEAADFVDLLDPARRPRRRRTQEDFPFSVSFQAGWGIEGNGRFCSESCGYSWAVRHVKPTSLRSRRAGTA
ncbi:MAG: hypothetical protein OEO20_11350 [Gemmatimonadota bacterium]|nr:hypothetical protein [Gemmatimonadota bacterium]MDH3291597.1 hypothetical protein [Gemmatimonadota bacterium]MDH3366500.1 hypothetical protein [Gemmatimonadota bacterium]MDH3478889.1 hypothetical protein [Gemmatimonadota bacterium]MDH3571205.1 hypothetical protein [Gemmatimonadota bacterium]